MSKSTKLWDSIKANFKYLAWFVGLIIYIISQIQKPVQTNAIQQKEIDQLKESFTEERDARIASDTKVESALNKFGDNQQVLNDRVVAIMTKLEVMDPSRVSKRELTSTTN